MQIDISESLYEMFNRVFSYSDGVLIWKVRTAKRIHIGDKAGNTGVNGYISVRVYGKLYLAHRVIYLMHHGYLPKFIDHIDRNRINNNIDNLRGATTSQNGFNKPKKAGCSSKYKGVTWCRMIGMWKAQIYIYGSESHIGYYDDETEAATDYDSVAMIVQGDFAWLNTDNFKELE